jgi:hypothetical protein
LSPNILFKINSQGEQYRVLLPPTTSSQKNLVNVLGV